MRSELAVISCDVIRYCRAGFAKIRYENDSVRYFTVYEGKLLQTFPKDFQVTGAWGEAMRQIGNAVPVLLAQRIGQHLHNLLNASLQADIEPLKCANFD